MVKINADPYAITPDVLAQYQATYGSAPPQAAINRYNQENANYYAGDPNATGSVAGSGLPGAAQSPASFWTDPLHYDFGPSLDSALGNIPVIGPLNTALGSTADPNSMVSTAASSTGAALAFITDIPRVVTTLLGLILIIAGIFALSKGPVVSVVSSAAQTALTS